MAIEEDRLVHALAGLKLARKICKPMVRRLLKAVPYAGYIATLYDCYSKSDKLSVMYNSIPDPCPDDQVTASDCKTWCYSLWGSIAMVATVDVIGSFSTDAAIIGGIISSFVTAGTSLGATTAAAVAKAVISIGSIIADVSITCSMNELQATINGLKCEKDKTCGDPCMPPCRRPDDGKKGGGSSQSGSENDHVIIDPAGYVYEAVPENRVEGVQATIYYKEEVEDLWGGTSTRKS